MRATGWCCIAAADVQFFSRGKMRGGHLDIHCLSKLVHMALGWFAP